jgi:C-terminal processing protease CtpA/Prc
MDVVKSADLPNGGAVRMTLEHMLTPQRAWIGKSGLAPDEVVELGPEDWSVGRDPQLDRALNRARELASGVS